MKNILTVTCALALGLSACVDRSAATNPANKGDEPCIVITQPAAKEAIAPVIETLRQSFTRAAEATSGARVPNPQINILEPDGKTLPVSAPKVEGCLFGDASPKARQARLEGQLRALEITLVANCRGKPVGISVIKNYHTDAFKAGTYSVWAAGGGENPWQPAESGPSAFVEDSAVFAEALCSTKSKGGRFLIVSDALTADSAGPEASPPSDSATAANTQITEPEAKPAELPAKATADAPRNGDTIIVDVKNYPGANRGEQSNQAAGIAQPKLPEISLPKGVTPIGDAIRFATNSAKLTSEGRDAVKRGSDLLKKRNDAGRLRLFLVAKADYRNAENENERLSQKRAEAVQAALLAEGISIERIIAVGESLSPDDTAPSELAGQRTVQIWVLPERLGVSNFKKNSLTQR